MEGCISLRFIAGRSPNPQGAYTLFNDQKVTGGKYTQIENTYVLKSDDNRELKIERQPDSSLRDESGNIWRLQSRSRRLRPG